METFNLFHKSNDQFVTLVRMSDEDYQSGGEFLVIDYNYFSSPLGEVLLASTYKGLCYFGFSEDNNEALEDLEKRFPNATYRRKADLFQRRGLSIFQKEWTELPEVKLHIKASDFQWKVWTGLLQILPGDTLTYRELAERVGAPEAARAVGTAVGANPVALLIPCHRVVRADGAIGDYHWGATQKLSILSWEQGMKE